MLDRYYKKELYPFQDEVLGVIKESGSDFYLTGGTALGRVYLRHRYSDDLDLFVNDAVDFKKQTQAVITALQSHFAAQPQIGLAETSYLRLFLRRSSLVLKIEFVNDVPFRLGEFMETGLFNRIDSWQNILTNKISALGRPPKKRTSG
ncbi:MAG: nucleotidyl transferase AbiEii/AbiGii toxin family protein [Candidatus Saganbacteria bacterium]|nr:nucleotidyl transferase AbiEii/AbiGii toxin family protein [Candidatus Saganbacteria bacterium]